MCDRYVGISRCTSSQNSNLVFNWAIGIDGSVYEFEVCVRADNASERGVPFPEHWRTAFGCRDLGRRAQEAGRKLEAVDGVSDLNCSIAGMPKACRLPGDGLCSGDVIPLWCLAGRMNFVLCAHVAETAW